MKYGRYPDRNKFLADYFGYSGDFGGGQFATWHNERGIGHGDVQRAIGMFEGRQAVSSELEEIQNQLSGLVEERQYLFDNLETSQKALAESAAEFEKYKRKQALGMGLGIDNRLMKARFTQAGRSAASGGQTSGVNTGVGTMSGIGFL